MNYHATEIIIIFLILFIRKRMASNITILKLEQFRDYFIRFFSLTKFTVISPECETPDALQKRA